MSELHNEIAENTNSTPDRRAFLARVAGAGLGVALLGLGAASEAQAGEQGVANAMGAAGLDLLAQLPPPTASNEQEFRTKLIGPGTLSLETCRIAVAKATNPDVKMFATFEMGEQMAIGSVLKDMGTPTPPLDAKSRATLAKLGSMPRGKAFDKAFMSAQHETHIYLGKLTGNYIKQPLPAADDMTEKHGRHLATVAHATIEEHITLSQKILNKIA